MKYFLMVLLTFVIALAVTPLAIRIAPRIGAVDVPRDGRRMHSRPVPRFGGLAMFVAAETGLAVFLHSDPKVLVILFGGALIYGVGVVDDLKGMPAKLKFALQILCASVLFFGGVRIETVKNPFGGLAWFSGEPYITFPAVVSFFITVIWIAGLTNTVNLIDGLDGLAAGVSCIASACIAYCAVLSGQFNVGLAMLAVTGATLGFLPYNFHPAKIFMGDGGSLYLGFMIAVISIFGSTKGATLIATLVPFLVLGLPIFDTAFAIIRRWVNGCPIMTADKGHLHHRIMNTGIGQRRTVLIMYCISAIMGMIATLVVERIWVQALVLLVVAAVLVCVFVADHASMKDIMKEGLPEELLQQSGRSPRKNPDDTGK
ncbi:MAG: glycosyltransferase family 4 protein [Anaerovoracaceae bacterium]